MRTFAAKQKATQQTQSAKPTIPNEVGLTGTASPLFAHDFSQIPLHPPAPGAIQTKLAINKPGDEYEQEAEQVSDWVMRMESPGEAPMSGAVLQSKGELLLSDGRPLDLATRSFMEPRFGYDFSKVRIYSGHRAAQSARSINALAYTTGNNIVFREGQYQPGTSVGRKLLAHELTHVVQQGGSGMVNSKTIGVRVLRQVAADTIQRYPGCSAEQDRAITDALTRARRRSNRALDAIADLQSGASDRAAGPLSHYFGTLSATQIASVHTRMQTANARLHDASAWRCDTDATYPHCGAPHNWCAGTLCPTSTDPTHLCPPVFRPESERVCAEPSRAILLEHEALRAAGACGGFHPPGIRTPPDSLENVYSYSGLMYSIASGSREEH